MSARVYSVPGQTEGRTKAFLEWKSIDLSSGTFATVQYSSKEIREIAKFYKTKCTSKFIISYVKNKFVENLHIYFKQQK